MEYLRQLDPLAYLLGAVLLLLAAIVVVINSHGRRFGKYDELLYLLDLKVGNIHKDREATRVRKLQRPSLVPPPLPPRAPTLDATDWRDDDQKTEDLSLRDTVRYPRGEPPKKEPNE